MINKENYIYNDNQIMSPILMEQISKEYNSYIKTQQNKKNMCLETICISLQKTQFYLNQIKYFCSYRFYQSKVNDINTIQQNITLIINNLNCPKNTNFKNNCNNYCQIIKTCLFELLNALKHSQNIPTLTNELNINLGSHIINIINQTINLLGNCKYQNW